MQIEIKFLLKKKQMLYTVIRYFKNTLRYKHQTNEWTLLNSSDKDIEIDNFAVHIKTFIAHLKSHLKIKQDIPTICAT